MWWFGAGRAICSRRSGFRERPLKSVRLGWWRFQRCPVGKHWSLVTPVKQSELTEEEKRTASENKDIRIP